MLALSDPRWNTLNDAYGRASAIPGLLAQLAQQPADDGAAEPWYSLWSALAHQGDVYSASFAAVPHVVEALAAAPETASEVYFHFPAWVEICRHRNGVPVPGDLETADLETADLETADLETAYRAALARLPGLVAQAGSKPWDAGFTACALAAVAAAKGQHLLAEALLELTSSDTASEFLEWAAER